MVSRQSSNEELFDKPIRCCVVLRPNPLGFAHPTFESSQDDPIYGFDFPIGLGLFDLGEMLFGADFGNEALETLIGELGAVVPDERSWCPKLSKYILFVEMEDVV